MDENTSNMLPNPDNINPPLPTPANTPQHSPPNNTISAPINEEKTKKTLQQTDNRRITRSMINQKPDSDSEDSDSENQIKTVNFK